jgi:hypothetical protein
MATGKIRADSNFINPYPHAKIRIRARARNPQRVENDTRTRYPRIPVCPRITHMPVRRSKTCRTKTPALAASAAGLPKSGLGAGVAQPSSAAVVGPGCGRRAPQAWGPGHRRRVRLGAASSPTVVGAWARPSAAAGAGAWGRRSGGPWEGTRGLTKGPRGTGRRPTGGGGREG